MLAVYLGGASWGVVKRSAAHDYEDDVCLSRVKDPSKDSDHATCSSWCSVASSKSHCDWCKCRACKGMCASDKASPSPPPARGGLGPLRQVTFDWSRANHSQHDHSQHAATGKTGMHYGGGLHHQTEPSRLIQSAPKNRTGSSSASAAAMAATASAAAAATAAAAAVPKQAPSVTPAPDPAAARESWRRERETSKTVSMVVGVGLGSSILCLVAAVVSSIRKMQLSEAAEREVAMREDLHDSSLLASTPMVTPVDTPAARCAGGETRFVEFIEVPSRGPS